MANEDKDTTAAGTSGTDGMQPGTTPGAGDGKDGAGHEGDLSQQSPAELAKIIADLRRENAAARKKQRDLELAEEKRAADAKAADEERLKKQGEFEKLAEQRLTELNEWKAKAAKVDALEARIKAGNDAAIAQIPEHMRTLIPKYDPVELADWLTANADKLKGKAAPEMDAGKRGEHGGQQPIVEAPRVRL
jgi:hypothetical protein